MEISPLKLKKRGKRRRSSLDLSRCIICQKVTGETVRKASSGGVKSFLCALQERKCVGDNEVANRIEHCIEKVSENEYKFKESVYDIHWHKDCYSTYTSKTHLARLSTDTVCDDNEAGPSKPKVQRKTFNWKEVCLFCEKKSYKKDRTLINVATFEYCSTLEKRAMEKNDIEMHCKIGDYNKLMANEAKYHKGCHSKYIKQDRCSTDAVDSETVYDKAMEKMISEIKSHLVEGKAYTVEDLIKRYHSILSESISETEAMSYSKHKLKNKLLSKYEETVQIISSQYPSKPDLVIDKNLRLEDAINTASVLKDSFKCLNLEADFGNRNIEMTPITVLYYSALILRSLIKECSGIETQPLDPSDISQGKEENVIPNDLYSFIFWVISSDQNISSENVEMNVVREKNSLFHQKVLSVCQDLVYLGSRGKCKTPKHVGLSMSLHQMTQSKDVISLINKNGHGISYDELERIDTFWAKIQASDSVVLPTNMKLGNSVIAAGDNFNRATESLDGKHLDIVNMVLYQIQAGDTPGTFGDSRSVSSDRNRSIKDPNRCELIECPNMSGKQPGPKHLLNKVKLDWLQACTKAHDNERAIDRAYVEVRMMPIKMFEAFIDRTDKQIPGWTVFHCILSHKVQVPKTKIGYCPMIPASATDINTVYTMMKLFQQMFSSLGQNWTYVTYDEAIYSKAQMIKWRNVAEFKNDHMEMGGMHRAMNFMGDIGKVMEGSGFEDALVEANVYGPSVMQMIMKGRSYNRGVRTHKLANESMCRLKWLAFENWLVKHAIAVPDNDKVLIAEDIDKIRQILFKRSGASEGDDLETLLSDYKEHTENLHSLMKDFTEEGRKVSHTFTFWDNYISDLSQLLLDYIAAKRAGDRTLELEIFAEMLPLDFVCGHTNYARWGTINVVEGRLLQEDNPDIFDKLSKEHSAVYRTQRPFSGVWHDMAIEQSLNRECGKFKHLYTEEAALQKFFLTAHLKAEVAENMKVVSGFQDEEKMSHKEASTNRIEKDEKAVQDIVRVVEERMINPFELEDSATEEEKQPLMNIATSVVAPTDVQTDLCDVRSTGYTRLIDFVKTRLETNSIDFMAPIPKHKLKTFLSMNMPMQVKRQNKIETVNIDRQIFSKLTVISQTRDVDVHNILKYELAPVPLALFHLDGSMRKTTKSVTLTWIEGDLAMKHLPPDEHPDLLVIDLMMLLRMVCTEKLECKQFGDLSEKIASVVFGMGYRYTAVVGDSYANTKSIKSVERARRDTIQMQEIRNPTAETPFPRQKHKYLSNPVNKRNLADFILSSLADKRQQQPHDDTVLFLRGGFKDPEKAVRVDNQGCTPVTDLESDHEEADSRMFVCIDYVVREFGIESVVLWSIDSDVAAMCPRYASLLGVKLFFKTGVKDHKRVIPMHNVADRLGENLSLALPIIHALSGCDSTSAFCGIGKQKWLTAVVKHPELLEGIMEIGSDPITITDSAQNAVTHLVSLVYGVKEMESSDDVRYELFSKKGSSSERLPPTSDALHLHLQRVNYQSFIWMFATSQYLHLPSPVNAGWSESEEGELVPTKMTKSPAPEVLLEFTKCMCKGECRSLRCKCKKENLWCTDTCGCDTELCLNKVECSVGQDSDEND